jgi:hypothetical protein
MSATSNPDPDAVLRNGDVDWDRWPVTDYIAENYRELHSADALVIEHHSSYLSGLAPDSVDRSLELGAGPNLYPLMLVSGCSRAIDAVDTSAVNVAYLRRQLAHGPDEHWAQFYDRCRQLNPALPDDTMSALANVTIIHETARSVIPGSYGLASMHFVAEGASEAYAEFVDFCLMFIRAVRPGGHLIAAFMENLGRYWIGRGPAWPGYRVDVDTVGETFEPHTDELRVDRIGPDPTLPEYGYTGMVLLTARRASANDLNDHQASARTLRTPSQAMPPAAHSAKSAAPARPGGDSRDNPVSGRTGGP